jgi:uncharacterized membrane protein YphA (DoxX/SURF4 family)
MPSIIAFREVASKLLTAIPYVLATLLTASAVAKIRDLDYFSFYLTSITFIGEPYRGWLAFIVPMSEVIVACLLFLPPSRRFGLYTCAMLLSIYMIFLSIMVMDPYAPACACFGQIKLAADAKTANRLSLAKDVALLVLSLLPLLGLGRERRGAKACAEQANFQT